MSVEGDRSVNAPSKGSKPLTRRIPSSSKSTNDRPEGEERALTSISLIDSNHPLSHDFEYEPLQSIEVHD